MRFITKLAAVVPAAALTLAGPAWSASASTHGLRPLFHPAVSPATVGTTPQYELGAAGYGVTGTATTTNFKSITETATLRDPSEYASVTDGLGFGVTLASSKTEVDIGVSNTTTTGTLYYPAVDLYLNGSPNPQPGAPEYNAQWCGAISGTCGPAGDATNGGFPDGDKVTETLTFNTANGVMDYTAYDPAGNVFFGQFGGFKGQDFGTADVGGGFDNSDFNAPPTAEKFVTFQSVGLVSYSGAHYTLTSSGVNATPQWATSDGMSDGAVQAKPTGLASTGKGFSVSFEHSS